MDPIFEKNLIPTKKASELSGYTSDYLARLARSGKISAHRVGHSWFVDSESLTRFLDQQGNRKIDYARTLARMREQEYLSHQDTRKDAMRQDTRQSALHQVKGALTKPLQVPERFASVVNLLRSNALAVSLSLVVVISGAFAASTAPLPLLADQIVEITRDVAYGFGETFGNIPSRIAARIEKANTDMHSFSLPASADIAFAIPLDFNLQSLRVSPQGERTISRDVFVSSYDAVPIRTITIDDIRSSALDSYAFVTNPSRIINSLARAYIAIGNNSYAAINAALSTYRSFIEGSGIKPLALATVTRDTLATTPQLVSKINLALGNAIINAAHLAIRADTMFAYGLAEAAPKSARAVVALIGETGDFLAQKTARIPSLVTTLYLRATGAPAVIAPTIAGTIFDAEYAVSARFVKDTLAFSEAYLGAINETGRLYYEGTIALNNLGAIMPSAIEDTYLAALGKSALALDSFARVPKVAAVLSATAPLLAAVAPTFNIGEQIALAIYKIIRGVVDSTSHMFATLLGSPPSVALPSGVPPRTRVITVATSTPFRSSLGESYPSYTTIVRGVSEDFVNQSLASLRTDLLTTIAGAVRPIAAQTITNATTIQQINKIEDLSNLIVRNGDFRGSIFDSGIRVSATNGYFTSLDSGTTTLSTTTITGDLSVSGTLTPVAISAGTSISAPYFVATSTTATSTFAGSFAVDTNGFVYATSTKNVGIGILSPAAVLAVQNSTSTQPIFIAKSAAGTEVYRITNAGFVGIGTTTPGAALAVEGSSLLGNSATAGCFTATTSTASQLPYASSTAITVSGTASTSALVVSNQATIGSFTVNGTSVHTGLATFGNASTTLFSSYGPSYFGATATSSFSSTGALTLASALGIGSGGTGLSSIADGSLLFGSGGTSALTALATTSGAGRFLSLDFTTGRPAWTATSSLGVALSDTTGTLAVARGGTNLTNYTLNQLLYASGTETIGQIATSSLGLLTTDVGEGSNLYFTNNRVASVIAGTTTTALAEGTNKYYTDARADARINATSTIGTLTSAPNLATVSTSLSGFLKATAGALSTALVNLASDVTGILPVANGGTGWANIATGVIPYGNGSSALSTTTAGTAGNILALLNGVPTWTATTTFSSGLSYSSGNVTNTGVISLGQTYGTAQTGALTFATSTTAISNDWGITNSSGTFTFNLPTATAAVRGLLSGTDWTTFNNKQATISASWPVTLSGATVGFDGLSTPTVAVVGNIPYFSGANTFANVATSTIAVSNGLSVSSGTLGYQVGGANVSLGLASIAANSVLGNITGASAVPSAIATSSLFTWTGTGDVVRATSPTIATPTFTGLSTFASASTTLFSSYGPAYFGSTATSSFSSAGALTLASALGIASGGTASSTSLGGILVGNGTSAIKSLSIGTNLTFDGTTLNASGGGGSGTVSTSTNEISGYLPRWTSTSGTPALLGNSVVFQSGSNIAIGTSSPYATLSVWGDSASTGRTFEVVNSASTTLLSIPNLSTGTSTFATGLQATYLNLTSTTATSTFANGINLSNGCFAIGGTCALSTSGLAAGA